MTLDLWCRTLVTCTNAWLAKSGPAFVLIRLLICLAAFTPSLAQPFLPPEEELGDKRAGDIVLKPGSLNGHPADWGWLFVPENRSKLGSPTIRLIVIRQRATEPATDPPTFHLVGGPGNSNVWGIDIEPEFFTRNELVRVGYRGIDTPKGLSCPEFRKAIQTERPLSIENIAAAKVALRSCYDRLSSEGIDLDAYNVIEVADDIESARKALGYEKINLLAFSFGTQIAYLYALRHPDRVHRMVLVGAGSREHTITRLWDTGALDAMLNRYAHHWNADPEAASKTKDLLGTMRRVLASPPRNWEHIRIDPDKVRLSAFYMLRESRDAALVFDAFAAADQGDYAGLAVLSWGYDEELRNMPHEHYGEFFCKSLTAGFDPMLDYVGFANRPQSVLGSPAAALLWAPASNGGFPVNSISAEFQVTRPIDTSALVVMGELDFAAPLEFVQSELMPKLKNGRLVILENMGHMDVARLQHKAFEHLALRYLRDGEVDASRYSHYSIDFTPKETLSGMAGSLIPKIATESP